MAEIFIHMINKPYLDQSVNRVELGSLTVILTINLVGLYYGTVDYQAGISELLTVMASGSVIVFFIWWGIEFHGSFI